MEPAAANWSRKIRRAGRGSGTGGTPAHRDTRPSGDRRVWPSLAEWETQLSWALTQHVPRRRDPLLNLNLHPKPPQLGFRPALLGQMTLTLPWTCLSTNTVPTPMWYCRNSPRLFHGCAHSTPPLLPARSGAVGSLGVPCLIWLGTEHTIVRSFFPTRLIGTRQHRTAPYDAMANSRPSLANLSDHSRND